MNENQKIVLEYLESSYIPYISLPIGTIGKFYPVNFRNDVPKSVRNAYNDLDETDEAQILIKFGKWVLKRENN